MCVVTREALGWWYPHRVRGSLVVVRSVLWKGNAMSTGPIEFMGEGAVHEVPSSEYGGDDGLIQPSPEETGLVAGDGMPIGHELTPSEVAGIMARRAGTALVGREQYGELADEAIVDPHTGRALVGDESADVTGKSGREHGLADGVWQ